MLLAALIFVPICLTFWVLAMDRLVQQRPMLPVQNRRRVPWTLGDLLLIGGLAVVTMSAVSSWNKRRLQLPDGPWRLHELQPDQQISLLRSFGVTAMGLFLLATLVCRFRARATARDLGWVPAQWLTDLGLGLAGYFMLIVPMLSVHFVAQLIFGSEQRHPFIEIILKHPDANFLLPITLAAVVVAPLTEEFFFRVLLQGWLERVAVRMERREYPWQEPLAPSQADSAQSAADPGTAVSAAECVTDPDAQAETNERLPAVTNPWQMPAELESPATESPATESPATESPATDGLRTSLSRTDLPATTELPATTGGRAWPIVISALAFAIAHVGQGAAPIALFLLALGLGYVYQCTHRILPCVVIHFLVNVTAVVQLWMLVRTP